MKYQEVQVQVVGDTLEIQARTPDANAWLQQVLKGIGEVAVFDPQRMYYELDMPAPFDANLTADYLEDGGWVQEPDPVIWDW